MDEIGESLLELDLALEDLRQSVPAATNMLTPDMKQWRRVIVDLASVVEAQRVLIGLLLDELDVRRS